MIYQLIFEKKSFNNSIILFTNMAQKEDFFTIYANLPIEEREKVVVVIDNQPISWNVAYYEIKNDTNRGYKILNALKDLDIIWQN